MKSLFFLLAGCAVLLSQVIDHNSRGMKFYRAKEYQSAYEEFKKAVAIDSTRAIALFNLICTESLLLEQGKRCDLDINPKDVTDQLAILLKMKPEWATKVALDPDLTWIRNTYAFQTLIGRNPSVDADLVILLESISWYGPSPGAYGPVGTIDFSNGYCTISSLNIDGKLEFTHSKPYPYKVLNGTIYVVMVDKKSEEKQVVVKGKLSKGTLSFEGFPFVYTDDPDHCSA